ncbi:MAG: 1-acyl-sn-glycerol-3-phosphate acyltransferase [Bacteroidota bacterium]
MEEKEGQGDFEPVDIRRVMREKNPSLARLIPGFVYRLIHRIMRLDFMNGFMLKYGHLSGIDFVQAAIKDFEVTETVYGLDAIPAGKSYIFASNHPLGGFDSLLLMKSVYNRFGFFKFLVNDVLMTIPNLRPVFVPVNKHGGNSRDAAKLLAQTYESGEQILIFPSGYASRLIRGKVMDLEWQKHFIVKAVQYKRDVVPVFISGRNSGRFYWLARIRTMLRVGWNLEMFLLPDETYRHRKKRVSLYFGKPIPWQTFDRSKSPQQWAAIVKDQVYRLPETM